MTIRVRSFWKDDKGRYYLKWKDPRSGKYKTEQTDICSRGKRNDRAAAVLADEKQRELNDRYRGERPMTWEEFQVLYADKRLSKTSRDNQNKWKAVAAIFDEVWPDHVRGVLELQQITPRLLLAVESELESRLSPGSVASYSATLRAGFSWAAKMGLMPCLAPRPPDLVESRLPAMRLIPISFEDLQRMESVAGKVAGERHASGIADYMRCLWLCGGRLIDPIWMHPFRRDCHHPIQLEGEAPYFAWCSLQKNRRDQIERITLDFAEWIRPRCIGRDDWLFNPTCETGRIESKHSLSAIISDIGKHAGVIAEPGTPPKMATAKHFRSSFVTRWSRRGMPLAQISAMVRHSSVATTEKYYLAPPDESMLASFVEKDWIGTQSGTHADVLASEKPCKKQRRRRDSNPRIMDLQSIALAAWPRRLDSAQPRKRIPGSQDPQFFVPLYRLLRYYRPPVGPT